MDGDWSPRHAPQRLDRSEDDNPEDVNPFAPRDSAERNAGPSRHLFNNYDDDRVDMEDMEDDDDEDEGDAQMGEVPEQGDEGVDDDDDMYENEAGALGPSDVSFESSSELPLFSHLDSSNRAKMWTATAWTQVARAPAALPL